MCAELLFHMTDLVNSPINSPALPTEASGLDQIDHELFWSMRPNLRILFQGVMISTNELALRSAPVGPKQKNEFRILSLGESTTFGAGVENDETYSARLEYILNNTLHTNRFKVINAGVSGYTSFQSLLYLKKRGFKLSPDLVLFYHEYNDYLPTYIRDSQNNVIGMNMSDPERYHSQQRRFHRGLMKISAVYRYICYRLALANIRHFQNDPSKQPLQSISVQIGEREESLKMPSRVRPQERIEIIQGLINECRTRGIQIVIIHPSYRFSVPHRCELTNTCMQNDVLMIEAQAVLHPSNATVDEVFLDTVHPTALGHERLARELARVLVGGG